MALYKGNTLIAGSIPGTKYNAHHLLDFKWSDCIIVDMSWLRADDFSWQSGSVYVEAYNHLVSDVQNITSSTETIGSYTVTFYRATDGHKIVLADQETTVVNIYNETGVAWYYILDTTNTRFKLPRTKYGFKGLRTNVGDNINESLPNITGTAQTAPGRAGYSMSGAFGQYSTSTTQVYANGAASSSATNQYGIDIDASRVSSAYKNNAPVQERGTQMYLYFYVGEFSQTATEQTAGLNASLFNNKQDVGDCVLKTGDTMTGGLVSNVSASSLPYIVKYNDVDFDIPPLSTWYTGIEIQDAAGRRMGRFEYSHSADGSHYIGIADKKSSSQDVYSLMRTGFNSSGSAYCSFPNTTCCDGQWVNVNQSLISTTPSMSSSTALTYRMNLPDDGFNYEVLIRGRVSTTNTSGNYVYLTAHGNKISTLTWLCGCQTRSSSTVTAMGSGLVIASYVASGSTNLTVDRSTSYNGTLNSLAIIAYRRIGTNS